MRRYLFALAFVLLPLLIGAAVAEQPAIEDAQGPASTAAAPAAAATVSLQMVDEAGTTVETEKRLDAIHAEHLHARKTASRDFLVRTP